MTSAGKRIIAGLQEAIDGDFASVLIDGRVWVRKDAHRTSVSGLADCSSRRAGSRGETFPPLGPVISRFC